ncbi:SAM hydrolase/SAM-dependent halogenase family protein [Legionella sp. CNM-1927-20]|uniref:SAM hydrolase/SAM-dependent halogenase family protein n=1 Tax=Legionella sp. CNM-1927-20 TaxID=3422221 RepID=UPI00403A9D3A
MQLGKSLLLSLLLSLTLFIGMPTSAGILVLETDFGLKDSAVSAIKGVAYSVDQGLVISDLTHEIPPYNIWEGAYRLYQAAPYWPSKTVFVAVVDPGVGSKRHSIVAELNNGQYFVGPDNGLLTLVAHKIGIKAVRLINESVNRIKGSEASYTFHGRDVYGYTGARLASGKITFAEVGPLFTQPIVTLPNQEATLINNKLKGKIMVFDPQYGNVWTDINQQLVKQFGFTPGQTYKVTIWHQQQKKYESELSFENTFSAVEDKQELLYLNSLMDIAIGINQGNFAKKYQLGTGPDWQVIIEKVNKYA